MQERHRSGFPLAPMLAVVMAASLAGCFSEILPTAPSTKLQFICGVLDPADNVVVEAWLADGIDRQDVDGAHAALASELSHIGGRDGGGVAVRVQPGLPEPRQGWDAEALRVWLDDRPLVAGGAERLYVLWIDRLDGDDGAGRTHAADPPPGVVAVAWHAVEAGAARMGRGESEVARAVLLHAAGHALGAVNLGIPVQDPELQVREGPAGHDPDPASVLHAGWDGAEAMAWAANATYDRYSDALHADWDAAVAPGGVCAT